MWGDDDDGADEEDDEDEDDDGFYRFEVAKTKDQEENVVVRAGFMVRSPYDNALPLR